MVDRGGRNSSITRPSKYRHWNRHFAQAPYNSEVNVAEQVEKVTLPFDEADNNDATSALSTEGALALAADGTAAATTAEVAQRLADYAQAWGITIPTDFTPATKAQVAYWRELCGAISLTGIEGMRDVSWPADLAPAKPTLTAMAERGLIVRRQRAWHLKRKWHAWLQYLRLTAVPTPALTIAERPAPGLPTYAELQMWEAVCRWLDGQPQCCARLPMVDVPGVGAVSSEMLLAMRKTRLLRHRSDCSWASSHRWKIILIELWHGVTKAQGEQSADADGKPAPFSAAAGIDTWYLNRLDPAGLTPVLRMQLEDLQELARHNDEEIETPWRYDRTPLLMYRAGVNTNQGGGVSWSYILRNTSLTLLIRKTPLGSIIAQARLGSECLWRLTPRRALDEVDALVRRMWRGNLRHPRKQQGKWQVSQVHLAHDIANTSLALEQLDCYVSRSRRQSVFEAAQEDFQVLCAVVDGKRTENAPDLVDPLLDLAWEDAFAREDDDLLDPFLDEDGDPESGREAISEPVVAEDRSTQVYRWGKRLSGVTWSPGGAISFVQYDKTLEGRLRNKRFMEPIWRTAGWDGKAPVVRHEARLRRDALRTLGLPAEIQGTLDDPWTFLEHISEVWRYVVGQAPHADDAPATCAGTSSQVDVAWIRRVTPDADTNRSRWPTDSVWQLVQAAPFTDASTKARRLMRREQHIHAVKQLDVGAYGYLVSRTALLHPQGETFDVSMGLRGFFDALTKIAAQPDKDFGELVRQRRRKRGLPLAPAGNVLPFLPPSDQDSSDARAAVDLVAEQVLTGDVCENDLHTSRLRVSERRVRDALTALEDAEQRDDAPQRLRQLEATYRQELSCYEKLSRRVRQIRQDE
jgi:hypothetical protein